MPTLLLTTTGRKSGLPRTVPLPYFPLESLAVESLAVEPNDVRLGGLGGAAALPPSKTDRGAAALPPTDRATQEQAWVIIASFAGNARHPAWYANLTANPEVRVQIMRRRFTAVAQAADPAERSALWPAVVARAPMYAEYQRLSAREIPLVVLRERSCIL
jgi:deazaflavin-dependent oxidoreductase (nitroreductase family)